MSFVSRVLGATLPVRRKADKETVDALRALNEWAESQKHQAGETLKLLNRALVLGERDAVKGAYGAVARLRETGRGELVGVTELLQDKLFEKLDAKPERER